LGCGVQPGSSLTAGLVRRPPTVGRAVEPGREPALPAPRHRGLASRNARDPARCGWRVWCVGLPSQAGPGLAGAAARPRTPR